MSKTWYPIINSSICTMCGKCVEKCSHGVYDKSSRKPVVVNPLGCVDNCHGCGELCPVGAIAYFGDESDWQPKNIKKCDCGEKV